MAYHRLEKAQQFSDYNIDTTSLSSLHHHSTDYLWLENQQLKDKAYDALEFIASSSHHGLNPDDYHYDLLQQVDPGISESDALRFDLLLTDGLIKLIHDITVGRLNPTVVDPEWSIPQAPFDAAEFLQLALSVNHFKACLNALIPTSNQYHQLIAAAARYQSYVNRGDWSKISETPVLRPGEFHQNIPAIRDRLAFEDDGLISITSNQSSHFDENLEQAVQQFQHRHSLKVDGIIGPATLRAMNVSATERLQQIKINLERLRWLPDDLGKRYIMVNLANYRLTAIENDKIKLDMRVIVGRKKRPTPSFASKMTHVVFNPYWNVPRKLARLDLLPRQQANPDYFDHYNIRIFNTKNGKKTEVDPDSIDWSAINRRHFPYTLRQDPGEKNALGRLKFMLPNQWAINLHDTPVKSLFNNTRRNFSSGCIRVEDPLALANFSLSGIHNQQTILGAFSSNQNHTTKLKQPLSVYAIYSTVWLNGNELIFSPDSYLRDQKMAKYL